MSKQQALWTGVSVEFGTDPSFGYVVKADGEPGMATIMYTSSDDEGNWTNHPLGNIPDDEVDLLAKALEIYGRFIKELEEALK